MPSFLAPQRGWITLSAVVAVVPLPVGERLGGGHDGRLQGAGDGWVSHAAASGRFGFERITREAWAMGTSVRLVAEAADRAGAVAATEAALREIERVERVLSSWDPGSDLGRLNAAPVGRRVPVAEELAAQLVEAEGWARRTGRAFDPTVGALVEAWDGRGGGRTPSARALAEAGSATGPQAVIVSDGHAVRGSAAAWIDSGGFGKGAALRSVAETTRGISDRLLVDLGGQLWAEAPASRPWSVDVAHPLARRVSAARLEVRNMSVATSGASERPGHLLDPRTGRPVAAWGSVTVVSPDALEADVLTTALYVMGPEQGLAWASAADVAALFLETTDAGLRARWTEAMDTWLAEEPEGTAPGGHEERAHLMTACDSTTHATAKEPR